MIYKTVDYIWGLYLDNKYLYRRNFLEIMYFDWGPSFGPTGCLLGVLGGRKNIITKPNHLRVVKTDSYIKFLIVN